MLSAFKNFGVTFLISIVIFGVIAYFATGFVTGTVTDILGSEHEKLGEIIHTPGNPDVETSETDVTPGDIPKKEIYGDSFNFLVVTTDYRPDVFDTYIPADEDRLDININASHPSELFGVLSADYREPNVTSIVIVRIDKEKEQVIYSYVTPRMRVFTSSGYRTLSEVYNLYGKDKLVEYVSAMTGLGYKYTFLLNGYNMDELIDVVGHVSVSIGKDIYNDGEYNTFSYQREIKTVYDNGSYNIDHIMNRHVLGTGFMALNGENLYEASSVIEHGKNDLTSKQSLSIEIVRSYLSYLAGLDEDHLKTVLVQLTIPEASWGEVESIVNSIVRPEPEETEYDGSGLPFDTNPTTLPWETDPVVTVPETEAVETMPEDEEDLPIEEPETNPKLFEPDTTILETNFNIEDFYEIYEMFCAVNKFENKLITYPCTYVPADEEHDDYFEYEIEKGIAMFKEYRNITKK